MSRLKKILCLTILISVCMFPASAFASYGYSSSDDNKGFFTNIFSFFGENKSNNNYNYSNDSKQNDKHKVDKDWDTKGWFDWFHNDDWWDDICWWDDNKTDSYKLWERYYCY